MNLFEEDPLLSRFEMPLRRVYYPLGFPAEIATNSDHVLKAADENWGEFRQMFWEPPVQLRIGVREGEEKLELSETFMRSQDHLFVKLGSGRDFAVADFKQRLAFAWVSAATARNHAYLHAEYIEGILVFWLLHALYLAPVHAACVALNDKGLLFCGNAEAGKSSLAYACARNGWTFVTDDLSDLVRSWETTTVVGNPHRIRLRESATSIFPELRGHPITLRANNERAIEVATTKYPSLVTAPYSGVDYALFLNRQRSGGPSLRPFSKAQAQRWFENVLSVGEEETRQAQAAALRRLLSLELLEFRYSDLDSAVAELNRLVGAAEQPSSARELSIGYENG